MKQQFVQTDSILEVEKQCPWAMKIFKVENGYMCFDESFEFYKWHNEFMNRKLNEDWKDGKQ